MKPSRKNNPAVTFNVEDFIAYRNIDKSTYYNFSMLEVNNDIEQLDWNLIDSYIEFLPTIQVKFTPDQYTKYKYHPDILAYDVYGSTQLDFVILKINDMIDPKEFIRKQIYLPYASVLSNFLSKVSTTNTTLLKRNRLANGLKAK